MGRYITTTGTAAATFREISTTYSAQVNDRILANTAIAAFTITLPSSGSLLVNDTIQIIDIGATAGTNNITVGRNGAKIQNVSDDLTIDTNGAIVTLIYSGATYGWIVASA
jgi:hypothetical protein